MPRKPSKGKVVDQLCGMFQVEDYTRLEGTAQALIRAVVTPSCGVLVVWKPQIPESMAYNAVNLPRTPQALQEASWMLTAVAQKLADMAVNMAMQQGVARREEAESAESAQ